MTDANQKPVTMMIHLNNTLTTLLTMMGSFRLEPKTILTKPYVMFINILLEIFIIILKLNEHTFSQKIKEFVFATGFLF